MKELKSESVVLRTIYVVHNLLQYIDMIYLMWFLKSEEDNY